MSAQRLRDAAKVLRERAEAATPGPWHHDGEFQFRVKDNCPGHHAVTDTWELGDAPFIATMHPGVALALADWLDYRARFRFCEGEGIPAEYHSLTVADLILGAE